MDGRIKGQTAGMTDRCKPVYAPLFQSRVKINHNLEVRLLDYKTLLKAPTFLPNLHISVTRMLSYIMSRLPSVFPLGAHGINDMTLCCLLSSKSTLV